mmetsp:Transcript_98314/g.262743  ORF Transcript_98314/g.262743 Transcript_98314/m.262743 type:complete len:220 (+) Transcript_98314:241-900(+)
MRRGSCKPGAHKPMSAGDKASSSPNFRICERPADRAPRARPPLPRFCTHGQTTRRKQARPHQAKSHPQKDKMTRYERILPSSFREPSRKDPSGASLQLWTMLCHSLSTTENHPENPRIQQQQTSASPVHSQALHLQSSHRCRCFVPRADTSAGSRDETRAAVPLPAPAAPRWWWQPGTRRCGRLRLRRGPASPSLYCGPAEQMLAAGPVLHPHPCHYGG